MMKILRSILGDPGADIWVREDQNGGGKIKRYKNPSG